MATQISLCSCVINYKFNAFTIFLISVDRPPQFMSLGFLFLSVLLVFLLFFSSSSQDGLYTKIRVSILLSLIANAVLVFIFNETASIFNAVTSTSAIVFWLLEVIGLMVLSQFWKVTEKLNFNRIASLGEALKLRHLSKSNTILIIIALAVFVLPLCFLAIYSPPNNFDAHSYHLNRILYWINDRNLDHFPTVHIQQLYLNVFAEYLVLDTVLLSGSDYFAGLIQFGAFLGSLAGVSLISKKIGMKADGQILSSAFLLTLPIGIFESTSTQVDYVACFFFISFVYFGLQLLDEKSEITLMGFLISLALGGFTKYTVFIFAIPFTIYFGFKILIKYKVLYSVKVLSLAITILIFTFSFFFRRNYALFGNVMSPSSDSIFFAEKLPVDKHSLLFSLSGIVKNAGLHLGLPNEGFNGSVYSIIANFHRIIGVDINDLGLRLDEFAVRYSVQEDMVPNTIHFWLILLFTAFLFFIKNRWNVKWFWICTIAGFILFCTLLKFQLWSTRTHMPFFAMGGIAVAYVYCEYLKWKISYFIIPIMMISSVFVFGNPNKQLVPIGYITKKILGHIPVALCFQDTVQTRLFEKELSSYYLFPSNDECHSLKVYPKYGERLEIFKILDKRGYYDKDKFSTVFSMNRTEGYFLSHRDDYQDYKPLLYKLAGTHQNIGILFIKGNGFYHYWSSLAVLGDSPGQMKYIRYLKEFTVLKNARTEFVYKYILSDDLKLVRSFIPAKNIEKVWGSGKFYLVELKFEDSKVNLF